MQLLAEAAQTQSPLPDPEPKPVNENDDRSSSLSDPDDRLVAEDTDPILEKSSQVSEEEEDTEAETERLEESPDKPRQHKNVLLSAPERAPSGAGTPIIRTGIISPSGDLPREQDVEMADEVHSDIIDQTSPISSLEDSIDEGSGLDSPSSSSSRKRKREDDATTDTTIKRAAMQLLANQLGNEGAEDAKASAKFIISSAGDHPKALSNEPTERNGGDTPPEEHQDLPNQDEVEEPLEGADSLEEDVDMDDGGPELEATVRNEEEGKFEFC